jgi:hypothetical protein
MTGHFLIIHNPLDAALMFRTDFLETLLGSTVIHGHEQRNGFCKHGSFSLNSGYLSGAQRNNFNRTISELHVICCRLKSPKAQSGT